MATGVDLTEFQQHNRRNTGCGMAPQLGQLTEEHRDKVLAAMDTPVERINNAAIRKVLQAWGYQDVVSVNIIGRHRNGHCSCPAVARD